jgi:hypothetical protein
MKPAGAPDAWDNDAVDDHLSIAWAANGIRCPAYSPAAGSEAAAAETVSTNYLDSVHTGRHNLLLSSWDLLGRTWHDV